MYIYIYIYVCVCVFIYVYIYPKALPTAPQLAAKQVKETMDKKYAPNWCCVIGTLPTLDVNFHCVMST